MEPKRRIADLTREEFRRIVETGGGASLENFRPTDEDGEMSLEAARMHAVEDELARESDPEGYERWRREAFEAFPDESED